MTTITRRVLNRMINPEPVLQQVYDTLKEAAETIEQQTVVIDVQRKHIKDLNARIQKLTKERDGLYDLI